MSKQEQLPQEVRRKLQRRIAVWSDGEGYRRACELADSHRHLLPKPVTTSQLHGLRNVVAAAPDPKTVKRFTYHQGKKAERRGDVDLHNYWQAVGKAMEELPKSVTELWSAIGGDDLEMVKKQRRAVQDEIHLQLTRAFVQHLVAHSAYLAASN